MSTLNINASKTASKNDAVLKRAKFKQADVTRALKGASAAGVSVGKVCISPDGAIELNISATPSFEEENQWDTLTTKQ